ncbi:MAG TPA: sulfatase-like hydrolase/transferase [Thermoanaerobaculia bacterium]|nr:sulfatase-like hydrolase/transferase [Thermoanaerobaculia bacterium]
MHRLRLLLAALLLATSLAPLTACGRSKRPNVLLVTFDTTRWDHMGYATGREGRTPMLDAMAHRGTWFSDAVTVAPLTLVSHTSIMTGEYPFHTGVRDNGTYVVPSKDVTLAERLQGAGYATHAVISAFVLDSQFGLDQGFDSYDDDLSGGPQKVMFMFKQIKARETAAKAVRWLEKRPKDKPFFLWIHFFDPHANYDPPPDVAKLFPGDPYSGEIYYADRELGRVFKYLDDSELLGKTLFVFAADHGDSLGEHGEQTHGIFVYQSTTHVPMIFEGPGVPAGKRVDNLVRTVDIVPTILQLLHLPAAHGLDGKSLEPEWEGQEPNDRVAYIESLTPLLNFGWADLRALETPTMKVIEAPRPEVYDLSKDPGEQHNLLASGATETGAERKLFTELGHIVANDPFEHGEQQPGAVSQETRQKLAALGYLSGPVEKVQKKERPDPKDRISFWNRFEEAQSMIRDGGYEEATSRLAKLLEEDPGNIMAMGSYAGCLSHQGKKDQALAVYEKMIALDSGRDNAYLGAARILQDQDKYDQALPLVQHVVESQPKNPDGYTAMGDFYLAQQKFKQAEKWFRQARKVDPNSMLAISGLGNCLNREGRFEEAARVLRAGYDRDPTNEGVAYDLGVVAEHLGQPKAAMALYKHVIQLDPQHSMAWNNVGSLLDRAGKHQQALQAIEKAHQLDPTNAEASYNLGAILLRGGKAKAALPLLEETAKARPDLTQAKAMVAQALTKLGRRKEALAAWRALAAKHPGAWLNVARLELKMGDTNAAKTALAKALAAGGDKAREVASRDPQLKTLL